jgi:predicted DNA-binding ribbon-helix-helix protein
VTVLVWSQGLDTSGAFVGVEHSSGNVRMSRSIKRSVVINGHKTSVSLEDEFWQGLKEMALSRKLKLNRQVAVIDDARDDRPLSSAIRCSVLEHFQAEYLRRRQVRSVGAA